MFKNTFCFYFSTFAILMLTVSDATAQDDKTAAICAEAEERYADMFGHAASEADDVTVVTMYKYKFCPADISVPVGTTVRWVNVDKRTSHSVILKGTDIPESDRLFPEEFYEFTFDSPGRHEIHCGPHWDTQEMVSVITVDP